MVSEAAKEKEIAAGAIAQLYSGNLPWVWRYPLCAMGFKLTLSKYGNLRWVEDYHAHLWDGSYQKGLFLLPHWNAGVRTNQERLEAELRITRDGRSDYGMTLGSGRMVAANSWASYLSGNPRVYAAAIKQVYGHLALPHNAAKASQRAADALL